jgi:hypothetical protein
MTSLNKLQVTHPLWPLIIFFKFVTLLKPGSSPRTKPRLSITPLHSCFSFLASVMISRPLSLSSPPELNHPTKMTGVSSNGCSNTYIQLATCRCPSLQTPYQPSFGMSMLHIRRTTIARGIRAVSSPLDMVLLQVHPPNKKSLPKVRLRVNSSDSMTNPVTSYGHDISSKLKGMPSPLILSSKTT